jgi:hypothetical protein
MVQIAATTISIIKMPTLYKKKNLKKKRKRKMKIRNFKRNLQSRR